MLFFRSFILVLVIGFSSLPLHAQTLAKSIFAEYGYTNISKDSVALHMMFGLTRYRLYADEKFIKLEAYQNLSPEEAKKFGPTMHSLLIKERASADVFLCVAFDTLQIRMKGDEKERQSFQQMSELFNSSGESMFGKGSKAIEIQGFSCAELFVKGAYSDTVSCYVYPQIQLDPAIKDFPLYVSSNGTPYGLMLGRDEVIWNGQTIEFRAVQLEINQPRDIAAEMNQYQLVSKDAGEKLLKELFTNMMGGAEEGKN